MGDAQAYAGNRYAMPRPVARHLPSGAAAANRSMGERSPGNSARRIPHRGIVDYEPTELVITARAGTPLDEIEAALTAQGQMLAFEPPHFGARATLGGTIACGFSGPRRPYAGAARDFVLGMQLHQRQGRSTCASAAR